MKKPIINILDYFRKKITNILDSIGLFFAKLIIAIFGFDNIPNFLIQPIYKHFGTPMGEFIKKPLRQYRNKLRAKKARDLVFNIFLPLIILAVLIIGGIQNNNNFLFGFVQNLLADIIVILLALYILPKLLNKPKKYNIDLEKNYIININDDEEKREFTISIINTGEEVYKKEEIYWEIFVPYEDLEEKDITLVIGDMEVIETGGRKMWRFFAINNFPLFIDQKQIILKLKFKIETLSGSRNFPFKIYYIFRTINGNIPTLESVTRDFQGSGIMFEEYPKIGELVFTDWHNPEHPSL